MRTLRLTILVLLVCSEVFAVTNTSYPVSKGVGIRKITKTEKDTSDVNRYARKALSYVSPVTRSSVLLRISDLKANIDSAELICEKDKLEFPSLLHLARAEYFFFTSDYKSASQEATLAMKQAKNNNEDYILARTYNFLGRYCHRTGFFSESLDYFNNSITLARKKDLKGLIPRDYNGIADVYDALGNLREYRNNLQNVIEAAQKENDTLHIKDGFFRLGSSLTNKERDFKLADSLLRRCLEVSLKSRDTSYIALALANTGWNYYLEKQYEPAIAYYNKSLVYSLKGKKLTYAANSFGNLGTIYRDMGDPEKSIKYYLKSIEQAELDKDIYDLTWVYQDMSEMYLRRRDTSNAYKSYVLFKKYSDSQILKTNSQGLTDARVRYEADTHNKEVELLSLKLGNQRLMIYGYTGLFILSLAIGILLYSRSKINAKRRLSEMNRKISEVTQANLRQQMNPHFIFNTLNSIQYYMYQHDKLATNNYLTKFSSLMRKVLENSQHTSVPLRDELDALNLYLELEMIRFKGKFDYQINIDEEIDTIMYKVPTMLIQPYVENSICHGLMPGESKGLVKIDLKLEKEYISCTIEDNGIGREAAQEKKRKSNNDHNSLGTQIISSRLDLVNALYGTSLKTIYTDLKNEKGEPEGTRVEIHIPIMS
jgi:tetratricopeptide (TPR) repeat protein